MNHYEAEAVTRTKDRYALEAIQRLDAEALADAVVSRHITMCGFVPVYVFLKMCPQLKITRAELIDYRTSGEVSGDYDRVVSYAGFIFS
ncbi:MAG: AmmeMemoRadiSam system protein B [Omnitrophica bacterium GWA2_52_8]|nr:MAG: AmmeMemoRadiSam system protein B [Omnitrophica bacterium GWA2_52_8]